MKKLLHERLRDIGQGNYTHSVELDSGIIMLNPSEAAKLSNEIEKYYIPRPRFEDGEPLQLGDKCYIHGTRSFQIVRSIALVESGYRINGHKQRYRPLMRQEPIVDADGVEIKVGDTVWPINDPEMKMTVDNFQQIYGQDATVNCEFEGEFYNFNPDKLTHREPDSLEKLLDDLRDLVPFMPAAELTVNTSDLISITNRLTAIMERGVR